MDLFFKAAGGVLVTAILTITLQKQGKDISIVLTIGACCMVVTAAMGFFEPVIAFFRQLQTLGQLDPEMLGILLKAVGISLTAEVASMICADSGNAALGKSLQILAAAVVLWISIPLLNSLLSLLQKILGEV